MKFALKIFFLGWLLAFSFACGPKDSGQIPKDIENELFKANQEFLEKKFDTALESTERVIKAHHEYLPALVLKGKILFYTKKHKEARGIFTEVLKREAGHQGALVWLARIALADKKTEAEAEKYLRHGLNNHPEDYVMHMEMARYYARIGNLRQAMVEYQKLTSLEGELDAIYRGYEALLIQHKLTERAAKIKSKRMALEGSKDK